MDNHITIIDATANDVDGMRHVQKSAWLCTYPNNELGITKELIEERFSDNTPEAQTRLEERKKTINKTESVHTWVAKYNDKIVGFCVATRNKENHIQAIYLLPEFHGKGIGKRLIEKGFAWLGNEQNIYVNTAIHNTNAIEFYKKMGFVDSEEIVQPSVVFESGISMPEMKMIKKAKK